MNCIPELSPSQWLALIVFLVVAVAALVYWWARKAAKHPEYAAAVEAKLDALLRASGMNSLADTNLVATGQVLYQQMRDRAAQLEAEAAALVEQAKAKVAEANLLRSRSGPQA